MAPDPERAKSLFLAAADLPSRDERAAYLHRECGEDAQLRARVEALLAADEGVASLPHHPGDETMPSADPSQTLVSVVLPATSSSITLPPQSYVVGREIAHGGMGSVLHAQDKKLGRDVAMKVMRLSSAASEDARSRFIREATVLARLEHPNIVPIHELGWDAENRLYYTMKLVQGRTLQAVLNGLRQRDVDFISYYTLDRLLTIYRKVCDAMSLAHAKGVIHRDLKPDNIMVGEFGEVLVMDWGLAKIQADAKQAAEEAALKANVGSAERFRKLADSELNKSAGLTLDGAVMGTPLYMSPEQASGNLAEIDQQSDIFSLGGILYALLTLHPPVDGKTADEIMSRIKGGQILPPTVYNATTKSGAKSKTAGAPAADPKKFQPLPHCPGGKVPSALSAVTMRALSVDKSKRYKTVAEVAADIEAYQGGFATSAQEAGLLTQLRLLVARHRREFAIAFAAWFVITALAVWFVIHLRASEQETRRQAEIARANEKKAVASEQTATAQAIRAFAAEQKAEASEAVAVQERESARHSLAQSALSLAEAARREGNSPEMQAALGAVPEDLRDSTWRYLLAQSDTSIATLRASGPTVALEAIAAVPRRPGVFAILESNSHVSLIDVHTGARALEFVTPIKASGYPRVLAVSADGQLIAVGRHATENRIAIHSSKDGKKLQEWDAPATERLEFSPDANFLLQEEPGRVHSNLWNVSDGKPAWGSNGPAYIYGGFSPDGKQMVTFSREDRYRVVNPADGMLIRSFKGGRDPYYRMVMSSSGLLATLNNTGIATILNVGNGSVVSEFRVHTGGVELFDFAPGGDQLVSAARLPDGRQAITVWQTSTGDRVRSLLGGSGEVRGAAIHPLTGELVVLGPSSRVWGLTGNPPAWDFTGLSFTRPIFWGSDDLIFAGSSVVHCSLQELRPGGHTVLWKPADANLNRYAASADGKVAVVWEESSARDQPMMVLRNPGPTPTVVRSGKLRIRSDSISLSPNGDRAVAVDAHGGYRLEFFNTDTGDEPVTLERAESKRYGGAGWLDGGKRILGLTTVIAERGNPGSEERIVAWDAATGKIVKSVPHRTALDVLAVAPDGKRFAEAGVDKMVRIRDAATLAVLREFRAHDGPITAIAWHPSKPILATGSTDLTVRLWNVETGRTLEELRGPTSPPTNLTFSPSGQRLACQADRARIWEPRSLSEQSATTQPADAWEDLLASLAPDQVEEAGNGWRLEDGALFSPDQKFGILPLPGNFRSTSYRVHVKVRHLTPKDGIHLALPVGDRTVGFELDGFPSLGWISGLNAVNGKFGRELPGGVHGKVIKDAEQHDLEVTVRLFGANAVITALFDGQPLYEWSGPIAALTNSSVWRSPPGTLGLGTVASGWVVYEVKVKRQ